MSERVLPLVHVIRGERVLLDSDLAELYGVETGHLNQSVKRNMERFPKDFMFQLTAKEWHDLKCKFGVSSTESADNLHDTNLRSQFVISSYGGRRTPPNAFTEQGVAMLSSVLRSPRAIEVNIAIMRTFVQLRQLMDCNRLLAEKIESLEEKYQEHEESFQAVFSVIKQLIITEKPPRTQKRRAGFHP